MNLINYLSPDRLVPAIVADQRRGAAHLWYKVVLGSISDSDAKRPFVAMSMLVLGDGSILQRLVVLCA